MNLAFCEWDILSATKNQNHMQTVSCIWTVGGKETDGPTEILQTWCATFQVLTVHGKPLNYFNYIRPAAWIDGAFLSAKKNWLLLLKPFKPVSWHIWRMDCLNLPYPADR